MNHPARKRRSQLLVSGYVATVLNPNAVCFYPAAKVSKNSGLINWIQLSPFPSDADHACWHHILPLNNKEFALFDEEDYYIYKYNVDRNEWFKWVKTQSQWARSHCFSFGFDQRNQKLYVLSDQTMFKIDIDVEPHNSALFINGELHVICDQEQLIWNDIENVFDERYERFAVNDEIYADDTKWFHLKSRNTVLCLEVVKYECNINVYLCDTKQRKYKLVKEIDNGKTLMSVICNALSIDEKVVVLSEEEEDDETNIVKKQDIYILNLETMQFKKSKIVCPATNYWFCVCLNGDVMELECLVFGYIRSIWKLTEFCENTFVPDSVIRLMASFVVVEYLHIVEADTGNHWKIRLQTILQNLE